MFVVVNISTPNHPEEENIPLSALIGQPARIRILPVIAAQGLCLKFPSAVSRAAENGIFSWHYNQRMASLKNSSNLYLR